MLSPSTHPAGSQAMLHGEPGVIRQWLWLNGGPTALFFSQRGHSYRAQRGELEPIPELPPFEAWCAGRIARVQGVALTPAAQVYDDYRHWCARQAIPASEQLALWAFRAAMVRAGYRLTSARTLKPGDSQHRWRSCWRVALAGSR